MGGREQPPVQNQKEWQRSNGRRLLPEESLPCDQHGCTGNQEYISEKAYGVCPDHGKYPDHGGGNLFLQVPQQFFLWRRHRFLSGGEPADRMVGQQLYLGSQHRTSGAGFSVSGNGCGGQDGLCHPGHDPGTDGAGILVPLKRSPDRRASAGAGLRHLLPGLWLGGAVPAAARISLP